MIQDMTMDQVRSIASELSPFPIKDVSFAGSGRNSRIYRIDTMGETYALKFFRKSSNNINERLASEVAASQFFKKYGFSNTAYICKYNNEYNCALFDWIEGSRVETITRNEIQSAVNFLNKLFQINMINEVPTASFATEACISGSEVVKQVQKRLSNLERSAVNFPDLAQFLSNNFRPLFEEITTTAKKTYELNGKVFDKQLEDEFLILSPVDFGFHNALVKKNELVFFDFEYFGLDDSTHLIGDVVLHPGMNISDEDKKYFAEATLNFLKTKDPFIKARYHALLPLYALRWAGTILNPFLDTYQIIGGNINSAEDLANLRKNQFAKAEVFVKKAAYLLEELKAFNKF